ncbi:biotin/lipoyl-containing protein [Sedimentibacter saalensis]|uniref:biotin/lipoyl-containing protein n=1 Tax=Sedimentibacter saalensis TaxID=130788 RepID=UPI00289A3076|nr:biotin/lipoyl-containing protein [Sedimentibacter saalensis]
MKKFNVTVNGKSYAVEVEEVGAGQGGFTYAPVQPSPAVQAPVAAPQISPAVATPAPKAAPAPSGPVSGELLTAPMPGTILDIKVTEGQPVKAGDIVLILEAMKMENEIVSPKDGVVNKIHTSKSTTVSTGDPLVTIG